MSKLSRVLLIKPSFYESHYESGGDPQVGLGYISESLLQSNIENAVVDMDLGYDFVKLRKRIEEYKPDLIGISLWTFQYKDTYRLINDLKAIFPKIPIVAGGPHVSTMREKILEGCQGIDYGITLEGEETIVELCRGDVPLSEIKGLLFRNDNCEVIYTGDRPFIKDIDNIRFPRYTQFELEKYGKMQSIVSSRGCPYRCIFCPVINTIGGIYRARSAQSVGEEFEYWYKKGYRDFGISDDNFTLLKNRVYEICDELANRQLSGINISLGNGIRADKVDRKLLKRMNKVGFKYIGIGVEAGNNRILKHLRKGEKIKDMEQAIADACELGYMVTLFFLLGSPGETEQDVYDSINLALKYPVYDVRFYNLIPFPGTELFDWVKSNGYFLTDSEDYIGNSLSNASHWVNEPLFETPELSREKRKELYFKANEIVKWHTLPIKHKFHRESVAAKFESLHIPKSISLLLTDFYFSKPIQKALSKNRLLSRLRSKIS